MKNLLFIFLTLCFGACATHSPRRLTAYAPPSTVAVRTSVLTVRSQTTQSVEKVKVAKTHIAEAQAQAVEIAKESPPAVAMHVVALQADLAKSQEDLDEANARSTESLAKLVELDGNLERLQVSLDKQTTALVKSTEERNDALDAGARMEVDRNIYRKLTWKWRGITFVMLIGFVAIFIARQYFPFLKLL